MSITIVATAAFGLEAVVGRELAALGYGDPKPRSSAGRLRFEADEQALCRCNLWLRSADRVMVELGAFAAADFDALFDQTQALPWEDWLPKNARFPVTAKSVRSQLTSVPAVQRSVKKAIVQRLAGVYGMQQLPEDGPLFQIEVSLLNNRASLTLDASGTGLHKRGYGEEVGAAPLKETLAAGLVQLSFWRPDRPLLDPFCGSGTIPIEAAMIGRNLAPGRNRRFDAERWPRIGKGLWAQAREEAADLAKPELAMEILASDVDDRCVAKAE
jgi:putative N6-adenine-specific DNA methylase